ALKDSQKKMDIKLQMPPLLSARQEINEVITADPELKGLDDSKFVFTDISLGVPERKRLVVVRDPEGTLRKATWEERERMLQIYFPRPGREILPPPMFNEDNLKRLLEKKSYIFILDRACAQFEPDDPQYIHVTRDTYSHIEKHEDFDLLWSTRHYGPMVLYLTIEKRIDSLIKTLLMNLKREDIADLIQLYNFVHHGFSLTTTVEDDMALLKEYIEKDSLKRHQLELALQSYQEYLKQNQEIEKSRKMVRTYQRKRDKPPLDLATLQRAVASIVKDGSSIRAAAENFGLKKSTVNDALRRYRAELDAQPDILETDKSPAKVLPSERPATTNSTTEAADHGEVIQDSEPEGPAPGTSGTAPITPESVRPHPRIDPTKRNPSNIRKRGKTRILTDTPEKEQLEKEKQNREAKKAKKKTPQKKITETKKMVGRRQTKVGNKRKPSAFIRLSVSETSSSEPELPDDICDDESDMSLDLGEDDVVASDRPVSPIQIGKFVLVKFELGKSKSSCVYYVGLVESIDNDVADVKFLRKIGPKFVFPEIEDKATVDKKDIVLVLPDPSSSGGTARSIAGHVFSRDFSAFNIK
ncbi:hypothetical protein QYM36_007882, partial [Artemia franciscana]